jgi:hypothetical protein
MTTEIDGSHGWLWRHAHRRRGRTTRPHASLLMFILVFAVFGTGISIC